MKYFFLFGFLRLVIFIELYFLSLRDLDICRPNLLHNYQGFRDQASFGALIDQDGQVVDHIRLVHINKSIFSKKPHEADLKVKRLD